MDWPLIPLITIVLLGGITYAFNWYEEKVLLPRKYKQQNEDYEEIQVRRMVKQIEEERKR